MKKLFFILTLLLSSNTFAATGTGHAQTELTNPLSVVNFRNVNFGTVAVDPAAREQTVTMTTSPHTIICPASYVCSGTYQEGLITVTTAPGSSVFMSIAGATATLSDGSGNTIIFDPILWNGADTYSGTVGGASGVGNIPIAGSIDFTGNEPGGMYNTTNAGGSGYLVTLTY